MSDPPQRVWETLVGITPPGGSPLQSFVNGFVDAHFQWEINTFVTNRAHEFTAVNADGSHQLCWYEHHIDYKCIFDNQTEKVLKTLEISEDDFAAFCAWLKAHADASCQDTFGLYPFLEALTASEDYHNFLSVMFAEARKQQGQAQGQTIELDIPIPNGAVPGQIVAIEYLGLRYEVAVPPEAVGGTSFRVPVVLA